MKMVTMFNDFITIEGEATSKFSLSKHVVFIILSTHDICSHDLPLKLYNKFNNEYEHS